MVVEKHSYIFFVKLLGTMREENGIIEIERAIDKLSRHHIRLRGHICILEEFGADRLFLFLDFKLICSKRVTHFLEEISSLEFVYRISGMNLPCA